MARGKRFAHPDMERALASNEEEIEPGIRDYLFSEQEQGRRPEKPPDNMVKDNMVKPVTIEQLLTGIENVKIVGVPDTGASMKRLMMTNLKAYLHQLTDKELDELTLQYQLNEIMPDKRAHQVMDEAAAAPRDADNDFSDLDSVDDTAAIKSELFELECSAENTSKGAIAKKRATIDAAQENNVNAASTSKKKKKKKKKILPNTQSSTGRTSNYTAFAASDTDDTEAALPETLEEEDPKPPDPSSPSPPVSRERLEDGANILIKIRVYKPLDCAMFMRGRDRCVPDLYYKELVLTGSHMVSDIKEALVCIKETEDGFFFINNSFYVENQCTQTLHRWCAWRNFGYFPVHSMRTFRLDELQYQFGKPYVYIHDFTCEHVVKFMEIRLIHIYGPTGIEDPMQRIITHSQVKPFCFSCAKLCPKWVVNGCTSTPFTLALFCEKCLKNEMHGDNDRKGRLTLPNYK